MSSTDLHEAAVGFDFEELVDGEYDFYGVRGNCFRLDDTTYEVIEGDDGSFEIMVSKQSIEGMPIARVIIEADEDAYEIIDLHDDHCWLAFGSEIHDTSERSFDRLFYFDYTPKGEEQQ